MPPAGRKLTGCLSVLCLHAGLSRLGLRKRSRITRRSHASVANMDQTQPAGEGERIGRSRSRSAQGSGSAARSFSRSRSRSPSAAREPRDVSRPNQPASRRVPTTTGFIAAELTATAEPPLLRPDQADQKYEEASAVAVNACAEDTKGQTCWICFDDGSKEGLVRGCACRGGAGFAHLSCLTRGAQIEVENDFDTGWAHWHTCRQCKQKYHGTVACALAWACWKTYVGLPETRKNRRLQFLAMNRLGYGLSRGEHHEDALSVYEAQLSMLRRIGASENCILTVQGNLAVTYRELGRLEEALRMKRDVYSGRLRLNGEESYSTFLSASNYAVSLLKAKRFEEGKSLFRRTIPVAQRVLGADNQFTIQMRSIYAGALCLDPAATIDDLRESVKTLEELAPTARRVLGGAHPITVDIEECLQRALAKLGARNFYPRGAQVS